MARPSWDETWMDIALVIAKRAACTRSRVGAVVVVDNKYTWLGYNGVPAGKTHCTDGGCPRGQMTFAEAPAFSAYDNCEALHAEQNAMLRAGDRADGGTLYVTREPCDWDRKNMKATGLARLVYLNNEGRMIEEILR